MIDKLLSTAKAEIGVTENPPNSNKVKYNSEQGFPAAAWCCAFVRWCFKKAGLWELWAVIEWENKPTAYCPYVVSAAKRAGAWVKSDYKAGDVLLFDFKGTGSAGHIGLCESVKADGTLVTIEGNTSLASNDNGGAVMRRERKPATVLGAYRPKYVTDKPAQDDTAALAAVDKVCFRFGLQATYWKTRLDIDANMRNLWLKLEAAI